MVKANRTSAARRRFLLPLPLYAALAAGLLLIGSAGAALSGPTLVGPADGARVDELPAFGWQPVTGADHYEFELSADPGFNSDLAWVSTKNTRAALKTVVANGTYYWHVRPVTSTGTFGPWSETRTLEMAWTARPSLLAPSNGATLSYPADPFKLAWTVVPGASEYLVKLATDPTLGSLVWGTSGPVTTAATSFTISSPLAPGTYYWSITPIDAEGHTGNPSGVATFTWAWPSTTTATFTDLVANEEMVDPQFSWTAVPGAAGYQVEVNSSSDWATGSKVCCNAVRFGSDISTIATKLSPEVALDNNTYYWRVRAIDASGNAGVWNVGPSFVKTFANVPPTTPPSVKNMRMRDNLSDPYDGLDPATVGYPVTTAVPVVKWNAVPGASNYQVDVTPLESGACNWSSPTEHWVKSTSTTAWTPLGWNWNGIKPFPNPMNVSNDFLTALVQGHSYCVRVRPVDRASNISGPTVYGDWTYLPANNTAAFTWSGPPAPAGCSPCALSASDYTGPLTGTTVGRMPVFTWKALPGARSYFVLVARDASFTNVVDYAYTRIPAYAPRTGGQTKGYPDELTLYYWAVLPAPNDDGEGVSADPRDGTPPSFHKQSTPPTLMAPANGAVLNGPTSFQWTPVEAARRYRLQVAQDASFSNLVDDFVTDSTAYTSNTTYPADTVLYWRVRADAEDASSYVGLTWSDSGTFQKRLPAPVPDPDNPTSGSMIPTWTWAPVPGAISYDLNWYEADGDRRDTTDLPSHAFAFAKWTGVGILHWEVRANFPTSNGSVVHGPYSALKEFTHTIPEPSGAASDVGASRVLMSWNPRAGAKQYRIQVSTRPDFSTYVENTTTQTSAYAPLLTQPQYTSGAGLYWRVAAVDSDNNVGDFTLAQGLTLGQVAALPKVLRLGSVGYPRKGRYSRITITVRDAARAPVPRASVRLWGAGITARTKYTRSLGRVSFYVRATRYGRVYVRATKSGYQAATRSYRVR